MYRIVLLIGLVAAVAGAALTALRLDEPGPAGWVAVAAALLLVLAVGALTGRDLHALAPVGLLLAAAAAGFAVWLDLESGWPGPGPATLTGGVLVAAAGMLPALARPAATRPRRWPVGVTGTAAVVGAAGAAVAVALAGTSVLQGLPVRSVTATDAVAPVPPPPAGALVVRWRWSAGAPIADVRAAGPGVVVQRGTELVGLDSRTGRPRWSYRRDGLRSTGFVVSPDRRWIVLHARLDDGPYLMTMLDADTGAARWTRTADSAPTQLTDRVVTTTGADGRLTALALDTGDPLWTADPPPRCEFRPLGDVPSVPGVVLAARDCPGPVGGPRRLRAATGLDDVTGRLRWTGPEAPYGPDASSYVDLPVPAGGRLVASPEPAPALLDAATGTVVARPAPGTDRSYDTAGEAVQLTGTSAYQVLAVVDPVSGRSLPFAPCPGRTDALTTADGGATLCGGFPAGPAGALAEVRVPGRPPVPLTLTEPIGREPPDRTSTTPGRWLVAAPGAVVAGGSTILDPRSGGVLTGLGPP